MISDVFSFEKQRLHLRKLVSFAHESLMSLDLEVHVALLDQKGDLIDAYGSNPLHLSALEAVVKSTKPYLSPKVGETLITNDPFSGNTRLCDLTLMQNAFGRQSAGDLRYSVVAQVTFPQLLFKSRKEVPSNVEEEGYRIPPTLLEQNGQINPEIIQYLGQSGIDPQELKESLQKTRDVLKKATLAILDLEQSFGREVFNRGLQDLNTYAEKVMRKALHEIPDGDYPSTEMIEDDGFHHKDLRIQCRLKASGENILVSFLGTSKQTQGPMNCNYAMTLGACFWVFNSFVKGPMPINSGAFKAFSIEAPEGTLVNAKYPAPLLGGYYETSKRIADALMSALNKALPSEIPSQSGGTSSACLIQIQNKVLMESLGAGGGATKDLPGQSSVQTNLHNYPIESVEKLETLYPIRILHSRTCKDSAGEGKNNGGDGFSRSYKLLSDAQVLFLADRRSYKPKGFYGGGSALPNEITLVISDKKKVLGEKALVTLNVGDSFTLNTAGGGAWGKKEEPDPTQ